VVIVIIGILAAIALPNYIKVKEKAKEAEIKANMHNIQLTVERFAVDSEGAYPNYLIGGEPKYATAVNTSASSNAFTNILKCDPIERVSDPLLRRNYIDAYPRNPFTRNGVAVHQLQANLPTASANNSDDPLRNQNVDSTTGGTRFGPFCTSMGSVLCDPRFVQWTYTDMNTGQQEPEYTWANIEYQFWDMWIGNKPLPYLPGQFFYKGMGPIIAVGGNNADTDPIYPTEIDQYMMGGYGGIRTKGKDGLASSAASSLHPLRRPRQLVRQRHHRGRHQRRRCPDLGAAPPPAATRYAATVRRKSGPDTQQFSDTAREGSPPPSEGNQRPAAVRQPQRRPRCAGNRADCR
jgi:type II secretory pathway pseudopilin PulG